MNAELIVFCKVSVDAPAVIFDAGREVLILTFAVSVADGKIETVSGRDVSFQIRVEDVLRSSLLLMRCVA